jgi:hypothetical protein
VQDCLYQTYSTSAPPGISQISLLRINPATAETTNLGLMFNGSVDIYAPHPDGGLAVDTSGALWALSSHNNADFSLPFLFQVDPSKPAAVQAGGAPLYARVMTFHPQSDLLYTACLPLDPTVDYPVSLIVNGGPTIGILPWMPSGMAFRPAVFAP